MLMSLVVRNLAVVEDISLTFLPGMTSLTGETGAGKSMVVDALGLVLGDRADSNMIRQDTERAEIEASFDTANNLALQTWLQDNELDEDGLCQLRRTISRDGRSKGYINGRQVPLQQLKAVGELTLEIHGQHAHQSLLKHETQRDLLDIIADNKTLLKQLREQYRQWHQAQQALDIAKQQAQENTARSELLQYQVDELAAFELTDAVIAELTRQQQQFANASKLLQSSDSALQQLYDQETGSAYDVIGNSLRELDKLQNIEPKFTAIIETLNNALIQIDDAVSNLRHYLDHSELDAGQQDEIEEKLSLLHDLARKHHIEIEQLPAHFNQLNDALSALQQEQHNISIIQQQSDEAHQRCVALSEQIRTRRQSVVSTLNQQLTSAIQKLAIPAGKIEFVVSPYVEDKFSEHGADQVQIRVATNPGQSAGELAKIASGGELARISLAIQVATAGQRTVPTLIFDEVDVGIGGGVAEIVGQHLRTLAGSQQVICVTHLPQVAAQAHQQLQVSKKVTEQNTHIEIHQLNNKQRIEEIARMLGGMKLTETTLLHAEEMLSMGQKN
ncbi:DNA repair protein RecN [Methylophaga frappieri]|uniref:DNA repair protein RecN n=1 Tax=Methylophaga frappieri (strain ATCC BAA-2434 / DSM 25690 / JAM7) TaxID=754477 RepID=I1YGY2_METFJ|nr:DNA repair protein RecN [Methylophaga frappieri]AFJ02175.1 DNA repair protein RecN [Methylophaga frappieri]